MYKLFTRFVEVFDQQNVFSPFSVFVCWKRIASCLVVKIQSSTSPLLAFVIFISFSLVQFTEVWVFHCMCKSAWKVNWLFLYRFRMFIQTPEFANTKYRYLPLNSKKETPWSNWRRLGDQDFANEPIHSQARVWGNQIILPKFGSTNKPLEFEKIRPPSQNGWIQLQEAAKKRTQQPADSSENFSPSKLHRRVGERQISRNYGLGFLVRKVGVSLNLNSWESASPKKLVLPFLRAEDWKILSTGVKIFFQKQKLLQDSR